MTRPDDLITRNSRHVKTTAIPITIEQFLQDQLFRDNEMDISDNILQSYEEQTYKSASIGYGSTVWANGQ